MKDLKCFNKVTNSNGKTVATVYLYDEIGFDGITAANFSKELKEINPDVLNVRINSIGGSVIDGFGIFSMLTDFKKKGGELNTFNDGLAASTAGFLLVSANPENIHSKDYALLMIHGTSFDTIENTFQNAILKIFKERTGMDVSNLMNNGKDNFFTAKEAADFGFFPHSNIEKTGVEVGMPENLNLLEVANKFKNIDNSNNFKPLKMKKVIALLSLQEGASEEIVANAVKNALDKASTAENSLTEAQNKITEKDVKIQELQTQVTASNKAVATSLVENAIKDGKFAPKDEAEKTKLVEQALKDVEGFKNMVSLMPTKAANILDGTQAGNEGTSTILERVKNRTFRQLEREDSALLAEIKNSAKAEYAKLYNEQYKTNKTEADF